MSDSSRRRSSRLQWQGRAAHRHARCARRTDHVGALGAEVIASRLRVLGHPLRLRLLHALDGREATVAQLADGLCIDERAVRAHVRLLYRAGILARVDDAGPSAYRLADWPSAWLVDQLALRLRQRTTGLGDPDLDGTVGEGSGCR